MSVSKRLVKANELIEVVKSCGRKFFENKHGHNARLFINNKNNVYFIDDYTGIEICVRGDYIMSRQFSNGSGLNNFIVALSKYVKHGLQVNDEWLGRYWGYEDDISIVRNKALEICFTYSDR